MRVTVGAIRAIVRQEAGQLDEVSDSGAAKGIFLQLKEQLPNISDSLNDEMLRWVVLGFKVAERHGANFGKKIEHASKILTQEEEATEAGVDAGSSKTSGYAAGKASDADLDEGSPQTSGYSDGKGSDPGARGN
jgi:hypothetical protein